MRNRRSDVRLDFVARWLREHPNRWRKLSDRTMDRAETVSIPEIYADFLRRFGPIELLGVVFMGDQEIAGVATWMRSIEQVRGGEGTNLRSLVPVVNLMADCCFLCFEGQQVVDFDPTELNTIHVAHSFPEFLQQFLEMDGCWYWLGTAQSRQDGRAPHHSLQGDTHGL